MDVRSEMQQMLFQGFLTQQEEQKAQRMKEQARFLQKVREQAEKTNAATVPAAQITAQMDKIDKLNSFVSF